MIDIIVPVYYNYELLYAQFERYRKIKGDWRLMVCDNTPPGDSLEIKVPEDLRERVKLFRNDSAGIDGERHGGVLDYMVKMCETEIIGIQDNDFFWLDDNILDVVNRYFSKGFKCIGTELYYTGFAYVNEMYPERHGSLAPCVFGMFVTKELAAEQSFVVTRDEGFNQKRETGWRLRKRIIEENIPRVTFPAIQHPAQKTVDVPGIQTPWFYVGNHGYIGVHLVGGTSYNRSHALEQINAIYSFL